MCDKRRFRRIPIDLGELSKAAGEELRVLVENLRAGKYKTVSLSGEKTAGAEVQGEEDGERRLPG